MLRRQDLSKLSSWITNGTEGTQLTLKNNDTTGIQEYINYTHLTCFAATCFAGLWDHLTNSVWLSTQVEVSQQKINHLSIYL